MSNRVVSNRTANTAKFERNSRRRILSRRISAVAALTLMLMVGAATALRNAAASSGAPMTESSFVAAVLMVTITSPANNATFNAPASFVVEATASGGTVNDVEFFLDNVSLGKDSTAPYSAQAGGVPAGTHTLTAVATNEAGQGTTSEPVTIIVTAANTPPVVRLVTPYNNSFFFAPATVTLTAEATDASGSVARVEFYNGATLIGTATNAPYTIQTTLAEPRREYRLTARAYDNDNAMTTSPVVGVAVTPPASATDAPLANYAIPDDRTKVRFIDGDAAPDNIIGDDATGDGTEIKPYRTLAKAVAVAVAGDTIVFRAGTHRFALGASNVSIQKRLILQSYPNERVWIKASQEIGAQPFIAEGTAYRLDGWTPQLPSTVADSPDISTAYPLASNRDMVYINGRPLVQVGTVFRQNVGTTPNFFSKCTDDSGALIPIPSGTFCVDYNADKLYLGDNPAGQFVEATVTAATIRIENNLAASTVVRGLGFAHFAEAPIRILTNPARILIERNVFVWNGINGLRTFGSDMIVRDNIFNFNGRGGFRGSGMTRMLFERNEVSYNNTERFRSNNDADGLKVVTGDNFTVRDNFITNNFAHALWLDGRVTNAVVVGNRVLDNQEIGIFFEISRGVIIAGNTSARNNSAGIQISGSSKARIYNNTVVDNRQALEVKDTNRVNAKGEVTSAPTDAELDREIRTGIDWETRDVTAKNNIFSNATQTADPFALVNIYDAPCGSQPRTPTFNASGQIIKAACNDAEPAGTYATLDFNAYRRTTSAQPLNIARWMPQATTDSPDDRFSTLAAFRAATGNEQNGFSVDDQTVDPFFKNARFGDFRLKPDSVAINAGQPLPNETEWTNPDGTPVSIANVLGVTHNTAVNLGVLDDSVANTIRGNIAPEADSRAESATEDTPLAITLTASDPNDGDVLDYEIVARPAHGTLSGTGSDLTYTPAVNYNGTDSFTFKVNDGQADSNVATITINVKAVNDAPVLSGVPTEATTPELALYTFTASSVDIDSPAASLAYSLVGEPQGATINPVIGQFVWTPSEAQGAGTYIFKVLVTDGVAVTVAVVKIIVTEVNAAPSLAQLGNRTVYLGGTLTFTAEATDADLPRQTLTYSLIGDVPSGAMIDSATGVFAWTPQQNQAGRIYTFAVRVTDAAGAFAEQQISIGVAYEWSGVLPPINADGTSVFNRGRIIPVKFQLTGASAGIQNAVALLTVVKITNQVAGPEVEAEPMSQATEGNLFRYDAASNQYIFNLSTNGLEVGTYLLRIDTGDGVERTVQIALR